MSDLSKLRITTANLQANGHAFLPRFYEQCAVKPRNIRGGCAASWMAPAQFLTSFGVPSAGLEPADPGDVDLAQDPNQWKQDHVAYRDYQAALADTITLWHQIVDAGIMDPLRDPMVGLAAATPLQLMHTFMLELGAMRPEHAIAFKKDFLNGPLPNIPLPTILHRVRTLASMRTQLTAPLADIDKIDILCTSVSATNHLTKAVLQWRRDHPTAPQVPAIEGAGNQSYANLVAALNAEDRLHTTHGTTTDHASAFLSTSDSAFTEQPPRQNQLAALQAQVATQASALAALQAQLTKTNPNDGGHGSSGHSGEGHGGGGRGGGGRGGGGHGGGARSGGGRGGGGRGGGGRDGTSPTQYCWTHGTDYHSGTSCKSKAYGHLDQATSGTQANGGARFVWKHLTHDQKAAVRATGPSAAN